MNTRKLFFKKNPNSPTTPDEFWSDLMASRLARKLIWAETAVAENDWNNAAKRLELIIEEFSTNTPVAVWARLSRIYRNKGKLSKATAVVESGLDIYPDDIDLLTEKAEIIMQKKDWGEAITQWKKILSRDLTEEQKLAPSKRLVATYLHAKYYNEGEQLADKLALSHPQDIGIVVLNSKLMLAQNKWSKAQTYLTNINLPTDGLPAEYWLVLVKTYIGLGDIKNANKTVCKAMQLSPDISLCIEWAKIPTNSKNWAEALKRWRLLSGQYSGCFWAPDWARLSIDFNLSVINRIVHAEKYAENIKKYQKSTAKREIAIVTSYTKGYDQLKLPEIIDDRFDYIAYTDDDQALGFGVYNIQPLPFPELDGPRSIRYIKTHPHILLGGYKAVIWIDASFLITGDLYHLVEKFIKSGKPVGSTPHQHRSNISEEVEACIDLGKDDPGKMKDQIKSYKRQGFDGKILAENTLLMFNTRNNKLAPVMETWWEEINKHSRRDQLSFGYSLFKNHAEWHHIAEKPTNVRNYPELVLTPHNVKFHVLDELNILIQKFTDESPVA